MGTKRTPDDDAEAQGMRPMGNFQGIPVTQFTQNNRQNRQLGNESCGCFEVLRGFNAFEASP
jgi:hypothetical protein